MKRPLRLSLFLFLSAAAASFGQTIPIGSIVTFTSPAGRQLSAVPPQSLGLTTNNREWEQWEYLGDKTVSFHGTALFIRDAEAFHYPYSLTPAGHVGVGGVVKGVAGSPPFVTSGPIINGGKVILDLASPSRVLLDSNGKVTVVANIDSRYPPAEALWTISVVPRAPGRKPLQEAQQEFGGWVQSSHGTYLDQWGKGAVTLTTQVPLQGLSARREISGQPERPLLFGDSVYFYMDIGGGNFRALEPSGTIDHGLETVVLASATASSSMRPIAKWTLVPIGDHYKIGDRIPKGIPLMLRSARGTFLSADPAYPAARLTTSTGAWEYWTLINRER